MILKALVEFSSQEELIGDSTNFEVLPVCWALQLRPDGSFLGLRDVRQAVTRGKKAQLLGRPMSVPLLKGKRSVNVLARFLVDNAKYVLGAVEPDAPQKDRERASFCNSAYRDLIVAAKNKTNHPALTALIHFLDDSTFVQSAASALIEAKAASNDLITFDLAGTSQFIHEIQELRSYWDREMDGSDGGESISTQCLICGQAAQVVRLHSNLKGLRGASSSGVPLVSFNKPAFESYGFSQGANASICSRCDRAYVTALNRCLTDRYPNPKAEGESLERRAEYLGANITAVYWIDQAGTGFEQFAAWIAQSPDEVRLVLNAPREGKHASTSSGSARFHCLLLQGAEGRATIRSYSSQTVQKVEGALARWLAETGTVAPNEDLPRLHPLWRILGSLTPTGKDDKLPPAWPAALYLAALFENPIPEAIAHAAIIRNRAESAVNDARAGILQAWLSRSTAQERKVPVSLDHSFREPAYLLGRLLAVCDQIQYRAAERSVGRTLSDRFYSSLSTRPAATLAAVMKITKQRISQLKFQKWASEQLAVVMPQPGELPDRLNLKQQAQFALGFFHQRAEFFTSKDKSDKGIEAND